MQTKDQLHGVLEESNGARIYAERNLQILQVLQVVAAIRLGQTRGLKS